jgi:homoserine O-acetyltransferase/O-succinyltransferase
MSKASLFNYSSPITLESGKSLPEFTLAYETFGTLNKEKNNAILICHALSGDAHVAGDDGWWKDIVGKEKAIDISRFFVICINSLGSCYGSTGPNSENPQTQKTYKTDFPVITIADMVTSQKHLMDDLKIPFWAAVIGPSMGGMQALEWAIMFPDKVKACLPIATTSRLSTYALAFGAVGRQAITSDPKWKKGHYTADEAPATGLSTARMIGHITYLSEQSMGKKFGRKLQKKEDYSYEFSTDFQIESYLQHQGDKFVGRFDANTYLFLSKAMSYFDLEKKYGSLEKAFERTDCRFLIMSISSDMLYRSEQSREMARILMRLNKPVTFAEIESPFGHDGFLLEHEKQTRVLKPFLEGLL